MRFRSVIIAAFVASLAVGATACAETPPATPPQSTIDQSVIPVRVGAATITNAGGSFAQTFTAGRSGTLDKVSLGLTESWLPPFLGPVNVTIQTTLLGTPTDTVLGSTTYSGPYAPTFSTSLVDIPLASAATVTAGVIYAIVVTPVSSSDVMYWNIPTAQTYPAGRLWIRNPGAGPWDLFSGGISGGFATWVY